jgi:glutathione S-transferase
VTARNDGTHFRYISNLLARNGRSLFVVGDQLSIADIQLFDIIDLHARHVAFPDLMRQHFSDLVAYREGIARVPNVARYLGSSRRLEKVNANGLG